MRCLDEVSPFERIVWVNLPRIVTEPLTPENATCFCLSRVSLKCLYELAPFQHVGWGPPALPWSPALPLSHRHKKITS